MASKIDPFAKLLGKVSDERIAEMAGVKTSTVVTYRARLGIGLPEIDQSTAQPDPDENLTPVDPAPTPEPDAVVEAEPPVEADTFDLDGMTAAAVVDDDDDDDVVDTHPAPACVRVKTTAWVTWLDRQERRLGRKDVYSGEPAAWLWEHHRDLVEPFPPAQE